MQYRFDSISRLRSGLGLSQAEFAKQLGVDRQRISQLENDNTKPNVATLEKIMTIFRVKPDFFSQILTIMLAQNKKEPL